LGVGLATAETRVEWRRQAWVPLAREGPAASGRRARKDGWNGPHRLTVRTPLFQGGDRGSIPRGGVSTRSRRGWVEGVQSAGVAQLVERLLAMQKVAGSSPVARSDRSRLGL